MQPGDVAPSAAALLTGIGRTRAAGTALAALAAAALMALALALAAAGLHGLGGALGNDLFHRLRDSAALTSRRLAITRAAMTAAIAGGGAATVWHTVEPRQLIAAAIALSAAFVAPLLLLALWPPATARDAATGLLAGGGFAILAAGRLGAAPDIDQAARAVLLVAATVLATGLAASLFHAGPRPRSAFPRDLLRGTGDALPPDKAA